MTSAIATDIKTRIHVDPLVGVSFTTAMRQVSTAFDSAVQGRVASTRQWYQRGGSSPKPVLTNSASAQSRPQTSVKDVIKDSLRWSVYDEEKDKSQRHRVDKYVNRSEAMERLVDAIRAQIVEGSNAYALTCCQAAGRFLTHEDPRYRAVACEFLAHFPIESIHLDFVGSIGNLLVCKNQAFTNITVAEVANIALRQITSVEFRGDDSFRKWWKEHRDCSTQSWYWARLARLDHPPAVVEDISNYTPDVQVKTCLLFHLFLSVEPVKTNNRVAAESEVILHVNTDQAIEQTVGLMKGKPYKERMFRWLRGNVDWTEAQSDRGKVRIIEGYLQVLTKICDKNDAVEIERLLNENTETLSANPHLQDQVTRAIAVIDPSREEDILCGQLARNPSRYDITTAIISKYGLKHWDIIRRSYLMVTYGGNKAKIILSLAGLKSQEAREALAELYREENLDPGNQVFKAFVEAANLLEAGSITNEVLVGNALFWSGKGPLSADAIEHNLKVPESRRQAICLLDEFYE